MKDSKQLNELVAHAEQAVEATRWRATHVMTPGRRQVSMLGVLALAAVALWAWLLQSGLFERVDIEQDLQILLAEARTLIDRNEGGLPETLGNPALAQLVHYEVIDRTSTPQRYRLTARIAGHEAQWTSR